MEKIGSVIDTNVQHLKYKQRMRGAFYLYVNFLSKLLKNPKFGKIPIYVVVINAVLDRHINKSLPHRLSVLKPFMKVKYYNKTLLKLRRVFPEGWNYCRATAYANALNFLGYKRKNGFGLTPEFVVAGINENRRHKNLTDIDPQKTVIPSQDLDEFAKDTKVCRVLRVFGKKYLNKDLFRELLKNKILIGSYHQELYIHPELNEISFDHIPNDLLEKLSKDETFVYDHLTEFYDSLLKVYNRPLDEGHVDLVLDVIRSYGTDYVVLANLNNIKGTYVKIPWNLYTNYMVMDWTQEVLLENTNELPKPEDFEKLRENGTFKDGKYDFVYGMLEIFYTPKQQKLLNRILKDYGIN